MIFVQSPGRISRLFSAKTLLNCPAVRSAAGKVPELDRGRGTGVGTGSAAHLLCLCSTLTSVYFLFQEMHCKIDWDLK